MTERDAFGNPIAPGGAATPRPVTHSPQPADDAIEPPPAIADIVRAATPPQTAQQPPPLIDVQPPAAGESLRGWVLNPQTGEKIPFDAASIQPVMRAVTTAFIAFIIAAIAAPIGAAAAIVWVLARRSRIPDDTPTTRFARRVLLGSALLSAAFLFFWGLAQFA